SNHDDEPATSVTVLAIQPPVQLSAVTSRSRAASSRAPSACASAASATSPGTSIAFTRVESDQYPPCPPGLSRRKRKRPAVAGRFRLTLRARAQRYLNRTVTP